MSHSRNRFFLAVVLLSVNLLAACTHRRTDRRADAATFTPSSVQWVTRATAAVHPSAPTRSTVEMPPPVLPAEIHNLELVGYLGTAQAQAVSIQGDHAYVGFGIALAVLDVSSPGRPQRVGYTVLPNWVLDVATAGAYAYIATGRDGLYVVDTSDPTRPTVLSIYYVPSHVSSVTVSGSRAFVSAGGALHILDLSDPAVPVERGVFYSPMSTVDKVASAGGDFVYLTHHGGSSKSGGLRIVDVSDPARPVEVGSFVTGSLVRDAAVSGDYAYLLVGQGMPRLVIVDISDPKQPVEVSLDPTAPWLGQSLAVVGRYLYLAYPGHADSAGYVQVLDVADPTHPAELGRYEGINPPVADMALQGQWVYIAAGDGLHAVNVAQPTTPAIAGSYRPDSMPQTGRGVAVAGPYVYVASGESGLLVVDVADPANPKVVGRHDTAGQAWDVALAGDLAFLADENNGLRVIDVADPFDPVEVGFYDVPGLQEFFHGVAVAGGYAYVADGGLLETGLRVVDISDPVHPREVGFLPIEIQTTDDFLPARAEGVAAANGYVYLAAGTAGLRVVDVSNPVAPTEIGFYDTPGRADNLIVAGHYAYLSDGDLRAVDVSDPTAPALIGFYDVPGGPLTPRVAVQGRYAYVTGSGIRVLDVSNPGKPVEVAAYPLAEGNVAAAGDMIYVAGNGLFLLRALGPGDAGAPQSPPPMDNGKCETHTAVMTLSASATKLKIGEACTVTVTLANQGCVALGLPQYRLYVGSDDGQPVFDPEGPEPAVHYRGIAPGQSDAAEFVLRAVRPGRATLSASASFEVHLGYPGPAYWSGSPSGRLEITVRP